jgi:hypothetical protein
MTERDDIDPSTAGRIDREAEVAETRDDLDRQNREADERAAGGAPGSPEETRESVPDEDLRRGTTHGV